MMLSCLTVNSSCSPSALEDPVMLREAVLSDAEDIARIHIQTWQESYQNLLHSDYLTSLDLRERTQGRKKLLKTPPLDFRCFVALIRTKLIGFCDVGRAPPDLFPVKGQIHSLYLLDKYKGRGIGARLWYAAVHYLEQRDLVPYMNWVLEENHRAKRFYEAKGGELFLREDVEFGGRFYKKVGYRYQKHPDILSKIEKETFLS